MDEVNGHAAGLSQEAFIHAERDAVHHKNFVVGAGFVLLYGKPG